MARLLKDACIKWSGNIPAEWNSVALKYLCDMQAGKNLSAEQIADEGEYPVYGGNGLRGFFFDFNTNGHYLLVGRQGALCGNVHQVEGKFWATEHAVVTKCTSLAEIRFLYYLLIGMELNQYASNTAAQPGLSVSEIGNVRTCLVPLAEQRRIAAFLDRKCVEIDAVIEHTKTTIEEYKKLKQAVITEAVTKGVRGARKMKDSGIEWIGEIPEEWEARKLSGLAERIVVGVVIRPSEYFDEQGTVPFIRGINVKEYRIVDNDFVYITEESNRALDKSIVHTGDVLIVRDGSIGTSCVVPAQYDGANVVSLVIVTTGEELLSDYLCYLLNSDIGKHQFEMTKVGSALTHTSVGAVSKIKCLIPSVAEQQEIIDYLNAKRAALDTLIAKKTALLTELETYKKSLIYEYVTGKTEVM